ncbi:MAG: tetratricopeptide repeat protein [Gammaproteobacteria bacterium]|nr:tetratricopeptide repeat protein [Gammaproteobacteria bacterium]
MPSINSTQGLYAALLMMTLMLTACTGGMSTSANYRDRKPVEVSAAVEARFKEALSFMKQEKYAEAIPLLEAIVAKNDQLTGAYINLGIAYMKLSGDIDNADNMEKAGAALAKAVAVDPMNAVAQNEYGLFLRRTGQFEEAKKAYEKAIKSDPAYAKVHLNLGVLCDIYIDLPKCAVEHFEKYQQLNPSDAQKVSMWLSDVRQRAGIAEPSATPPSALPVDNSVPAPESTTVAPVSKGS